MTDPELHISRTIASLGEGQFEITPQGGTAEVRLAFEGRFVDPVAFLASIRPLAEALRPFAASMPDAAGSFRFVCRVGDFIDAASALAAFESALKGDTP